MSARAEVAHVTMLVKAFDIALTPEDYEALQDRQDVRNPEPGMVYRDRAHPTVVFKYVSDGHNWHRYFWEAYPWRDPRHVGGGEGWA